MTGRMSAVVSNMNAAAQPAGESGSKFEPLDRHPRGGNQIESRRHWSADSREDGDTHPGGRGAQRFQLHFQQRYEGSLWSGSSAKIDWVEVRWPSGTGGAICEPAQWIEFTLVKEGSGEAVPAGIEKA